MAPEDPAKAKKPLWRRVAAGVLITIVLAGALLALTYQQPRIIGHDHAYIVLSGSMVPHFRPGDVVFVDEVPLDSLQPGDVITFRSEVGSTTFFTHRIIEVVENNGQLTFRTKGDANEDADTGVVTAAMVVGKQVATLPKVGHALTFINTKPGFVALVLAPAWLIVLTQLVYLYRELDAADKRRKERKAAAKGLAGAKPTPGSSESAGDAKTARRRNPRAGPPMSRPGRRAPPP